MSFAKSRISLLYLGLESSELSAMPIQLELNKKKNITNQLLNKEQLKTKKHFDIINYL